MFVLVSANVSRELTTAVMWLNEKALDIRCVRVRPYAYESKTLIDVQQVIPLPETADYQVQVREKKVLHRFEYSDFSASSEEACRHRLRADGLEKVNRVRWQGLQSGTPTGA